MINPPPIPITLTQEEIDEFNKMWDAYADDNVVASGTFYNGRPATWYDPAFRGGITTAKRHKWKSILLLNHRVENCEHCDIAREKAKGDWCE
jgi:hypothetical protein